MKILHNPLSKDEDSVFDDKLGDPVNQLNLLSGMGPK